MEMWVADKNIPMALKVRLRVIETSIISYLGLLHNYMVAESPDTDTRVALLKKK